MVVDETNRTSTGNTDRTRLVLQNLGWPRGSPPFFFLNFLARSGVGTGYRLQDRLTGDSSETN